MTPRRLLRVAVVVVLALLGSCSAPARAQVTAVDLYVDPAIGATDREAVRSELERDLGRPVRLVEAAPAGDGLAVTKGAGESAVVAFRSGDRLTERAVDLPAGPADRARTIALLSGNVVRDEAAELLGQLQAKAPRASAARAFPGQPTAPSRPPPAASAERPAAAEAEKDDAAPEPPPVRCVDSKDADWLGADLVPYIGLSSVRGAEGTRQLSLNAVGGLTRGIVGGELAGGLNLTRDTMCGGQLAGIVNVVGHSTRGVQIGGVLNVVGDRVEGTQIAGIATVAGRTSGLQIGGIMNRAAGGLDGVQIAGIVNVASGKVDGAQIAPVNVATGHARVQVGVVNIAPTADAPIGLVSIMTKGRTQAFASVATWGLVSVGLRHGSGIVHNLYGVGATPFGDPARGVLTGGIGLTAASSKRATLDVDVLGHAVFRLDRNDPAAAVMELRVPIGVKLSDSFTLWGAPAYDVAIADSAEAADVNAFAVWILDDGPSSFVRGFPSVSAGVSLEL